MSKIMLVDGNSIINRAFYALPLLSNSKGVYTNAVYGFMNIFLKFYEAEKPDLVGIAFDLKAPTFRHKVFADYKGQRKGMPDELRSQVPILKDLLDKMHITRLELEGYEADDIIGTLAKEYERKDYDVVVVSGDRDLLQVATDKINIKIPKTKKTGTEVESYYEKDVIEKMCVTPREYIDVKSLMGDTSDNIPGVPGVGEKTAFKLICEYKSLENLYENIDKLSGKLKENLEVNKELAFDCRYLATIMLDVPIEYDISKSISIFNDDVKNMLIELETKALYERLKKNYGEDSPVAVKEEVIKELEEKIQSEGFITTDIKEFVNLTDENRFMNILDGILKDSNMFIYKMYTLQEFDSISFVSNDKIYFCKVKSLISEDGISENLIKNYLKKIFENKNIKKISYDMKKDIKFLISRDIKISNYYDLMIAYYVFTLSNGPYLLYDFAQEILARDIRKEEDILLVKDKGSKARYMPSELDINDLEEYMTETLNIIKCGYEVIEEKFKNDTSKNKLFEEIENPLVEVLAKIEENGMKVDIEELRRYSTDINLKVKEVESEIYKHAGYEFNISSPKQLADVLFNKLMLVSKKKTKTGMSTNIDVLEKLRGEHPIIDYIIEYRQLEKLRSTYADGMFQYISMDGKIHTTFNQTITSTGRLSSTDPNLQNIPIRMELGRKIRKAFVPSSPEYIFLDADYSQIELRIMAHMSGDENLIKAYADNLDIHTFTASQVFNVPYDEVTQEQRSNAKAVNFGLIYGISSFGLSNDIKISRKEAEKYIQSYFEKYSRVKEYLDELVKDAEVKGYSTTMFGRERKIDELRDTNHMKREFGKRVAMNSPIQGTAADIMKLAMIKFDQRIEKEKYDAKIILQVHDELVVEVNRKQKDEVAKALKEEMEKVVSLSIPLSVNVASGETWYESK